MDLPTYFEDFLARIRLTADEQEACATAHHTMRDRLLADADLAPLIVNSFLQGSYKRATNIKPANGQRSDVDVIVVTRLAQSDYPDPGVAMDLFRPFLDEHYPNRYEQQGRSFGVDDNGVDLDLVITSAPSEEQVGLLSSKSLASDETVSELSVDFRSWEPFSKALAESAPAHWKLAPLYIPDREALVWEPTHPLAQIEWTIAKNSRCNRHYVNLVRCLKWWRRNDENARKYPKGYPVEHIIGLACSDGIASVAEGVVNALETITRTYTRDYKPQLPDHGVPWQDVWKRVSNEDFAAFYDAVSSASELARRALDAETVAESALLWRELFGEEFPEPPGEGDGRKNSGPIVGGFTSPRQPARPGPGRFA